MNEFSTKDIDLINFILKNLYGIGLIKSPYSKQLTESMLSLTSVISILIANCLKKV